MSIRNTVNQLSADDFLKCCNAVPSRNKCSSFFRVTPAKLLHHLLPMVLMKCILNKHHMGGNSQVIS